MTSYKFASVSCSSCGEEFGAGDHGYSHCEDHAPAIEECATEDALAHMRRVGFLRVDSPLEIAEKELEAAERALRRARSAVRR